MYTSQDKTRHDIKQYRSTRDKIQVKKDNWLFKTFFDGILTSPSYQVKALKYKGIFRKKNNNKLKRMYNKRLLSYNSSHNDIE